MNNNDLLTLLIAFVLGYFAHQMMRNMCGGRLVEGNFAARVLPDPGNLVLDDSYYDVYWCKNKLGNEYYDCRCIKYSIDDIVCYYDANKLKHKQPRDILTGF